MADSQRVCTDDEQSGLRGKNEGALARILHESAKDDSCKMRFCWPLCGSKAPQKTWT